MITLIGTIVGALCGGKLADMFGRKKMRFAIGIRYVLGAVGTARTSDHTIFMFSRFLCGAVWARRRCVLPSTRPK